MRRGKPLNRGKAPLRRSKPISAVSASGEAERAKWRVRRDATRAEHPHCEGGPASCIGITLPGACSWGDLDVHHVRARGMGGQRDDDSPLLSLCRAHHDWIESHRKEALALGLLLHKWQR